MNNNEMLADLAELARLAEKATPGPFFGEGFDQIAGNGNFYGGLLMGGNEETIVAQCVMPHNIDFLAKSANFFRTHHAEIEAMEKESQESHDLIERLSDILTRTANAMKGKPAPLHLHSWHDLPEVAEAMARDAERWRYVVNNSEWIRDEDDTLMAVRFARAKANLDSVGMRTDAIDAAMSKQSSEVSYAQ